MAGLSLFVLGPPRFLIDGEEINFGRRKVSALLVYLAVNPGCHNREALTELLFPRQPRDRARGDFRQTLSILRKALGPNLLLVEREQVGLFSGSSVWSDVLEFDRMATEVQSRERAAGEETILSMLKKAAGLYRDDFLTGFYLKDSPAFEDWLFFEREKLKNKYIGILEYLTGLHERAGNLFEAINCVQNLIALDPLEESFHRLLMELYSKTGQRSAALKQYESCKLRLKRELNELPEGETEELYNEILKKKSRRLYKEFYAVPPAGSHNLPKETTSFIGRQQELGEIQQLLLSGNSPLITLTGPGGAGKTRCALRAAAETAGSFKHGVFFIDLSFIQDPKRVVTEINKTLGIQGGIGRYRQPLELLQEFLRNKNILLILDNFEHVKAAAEQAGMLVQSVDSIKIVVTSREPLRLTEERVYKILPMSLPSCEDFKHPEELIGYEAVQLFVSRVEAAYPGTEITEDHLPTIAHICTKLDGLPLAIELAASRASVLSFEELSKMLDDSLQLLKKNNPAVPKRQQTLQNTIEWSYRLLDESEKRLFAYLSVFEGGGTLEAVARICRSSEDESPADLIERLCALVEKNLIRRSGQNETSRFSMLSTIRTYSRYRLKQMEEEEKIRSRHAHYYLELAETARHELHRRDQMLWLGRLEEEHNNTSAALDWFAESKQAEKALRIGAGLCWFWYRKGHYLEGVMQIERILELDDVPLFPRLHAVNIHSLGWFTFILGKWENAYLLYKRALKHFREAGDKCRESRVLSDLGVAERWLGKLDEGTNHVKEGVALAREAGDTGRLAYALIWAYATTGGKFSGEPPLAELKEAIQLSKEQGNLWCIAHGLNGLGDVYRNLKRYKEARPLYEEALSMFRELDDSWLTAWTLEGLGMVCLYERDISGAAKHVTEGMALFASLGDRRNSISMLFRLGIIYMKTDNHPCAAALFGAYRSFVDGPVEIDGIDYTSVVKDYESVYPAAWVKGQAMDFQQTVDYAIETESHI